MEDLGTKGGELDAMAKAGKELKCSGTLVIAWDYEAVEKCSERKIKFLPLWKWLLKL